MFIIQNTGRFQSGLVLAGVAVHLNKIKGAIEVPGLYGPGGLLKTDAPIIPVGAIGMACAAVRIIVSLLSNF